MFYCNLNGKQRSKSGALASISLLALLLASITIGSLALDISHAALVHSQLQVAVEAGALAGAQELAKNQLSTTDGINAQNYALAVTAANKADNGAVSQTLSSDTTVNVIVDTTARTVQVTANKQSQNIFAKILGSFTTPIHASATARAINGVQVIYPGQVYPLAVSLDYSPTKGPQQDIPLNSLTTSTTNQSFTLVLNPDKAKNCCWIKDWSSISGSPTITVGSTIVELNGVSGNQVQNIQAGQTLILPLILGSPPFNDTSTVIGTVGFTVTQVNFPQQIIGTLTYPAFVFGQPGMPLISSTSSQDNLFLSTWAQWQVMLIQ